MIVLNIAPTKWTMLTTLRMKRVADSLSSMRTALWKQRTTENTGQQAGNEDTRGQFHLPVVYLRAPDLTLLLFQYRYL